MNNTITKYIKKYLFNIHNLKDTIVIKRKTYIIDYKSINVFFESNIKSDNYKYNLKRELLIYIILNNKLNTDFYKYSQIWSYINTKLQTYLIHYILPENIKTMKVEYKGGRKYNYDFEIIYKDINNEIQNKNIEFKHNFKSISTYPQILSLQSKKIYFNVDYAEYIESLSKLYNIDNINRNDYIILTINYNSNKWFKYIYTNEKLFINEKKQIIDKSIHNFLIDKINIIINDMDMINKKLNSLADKHYMLWDKNDFKYDFITKEELTLKKTYILKKNKNNMYNTICFDTNNKTTKIEFLLRWKNHYGILNPAFQIKFIRIK